MDWRRGRRGGPGGGEEDGYMRGGEGKVGWLVGWSVDKGGQSRMGYDPGWGE